MKRCSLFLFIILLPTLLTAQTGTQYVKPAKENIRLSPNGQKIGELFAGTKVTTVETQGNWIKVNVTGWIWQESLTSDQSFIEGYRIQVSHILVKTEQTANELLNQLKAGASFEDLAQKHSIDKASGVLGGDLGSFSRGDLLPEFDKAAFKLQVGEISGVVKSQLGFHIIKRTK